MNELLKSKGLKLTKQRKIVIDLVISLNCDATFNNIYNECRASLDKSTLYRIIDLFVSKGILSKCFNYKDELIYSINEEHSHYFTCIKCHKREKLECCPIKEYDEKLECNKGYTIINHTVSITGICSDCSGKL